MGSLVVYIIYRLPRWLSVKNPLVKAGDMGSVPGWESSPGEGNGNPLQCSFLGNPMHEIRSNQYTTDIPCGRQCEVRGAGEDRVPRTLEVQGERGTTVGEEQRGTVPRGGVVPCAL